MKYLSLFSSAQLSSALEETSGLSSSLKLRLSQLSSVARAPRQGQNVAAMSLSVQGDHAEAYRLITRSSGSVDQEPQMQAMEDCSRCLEYLGIYSDYTMRLSLSYVE